MGRRRVMLCVFVLAVLGVMAPAAAITNGSYDGSHHPYVGYATNRVAVCSGALLSASVFLTAAHCFTGVSSGVGVNAVTGAPLVQVSFDPDLAHTAAEARVWYVGTFYGDPEFASAGGGVPQFDTHDVGVIIFGEPGCSTTTDAVGTYVCGPVPGAVTGGQYAALPSPDLVDTLRMGARIDLVGYGVHDFLNGGGPCDPNCAKTGGDTGTRFFASTTLLASNDAISDEFIKVQSNDGGVCYGDSGGPDLMAGTNIVIAVNAFGNSAVCAGNDYSCRVDTPQALSWIRTTSAAHGGTI